jgi:hypothetical protein
VNLMRGRNREIVVEQGSCEGNRGAHEAGEVGRRRIQLYLYVIYLL